MKQGEQNWTYLFTLSNFSFFFLQWPSGSKTPKSTSRPPFNQIRPSQVRRSGKSLVVRTRRNWDVLQNFYWFINNCTFHFSADSILLHTLVWFRGTGTVSPLYVCFSFLLHIYVLVGKCWQRQQHSVQTKTILPLLLFLKSRHSQLQTCLFFPPSLANISMTRPLRRPTNIFQEYW